VPHQLETIYAIIISNAKGLSIKIAQKRNTSYQELISFYLKECVNSNQELSYQ
jgi:hypothetical protein